MSSIFLLKEGRDTGVGAGLPCSLGTAGNAGFCPLACTASKVFFELGRSVGEGESYRLGSDDT